MKHVLGICGSASQNSTNLSILRRIAALSAANFRMEIIDDLTVFPHFTTAQTLAHVPKQIEEIRAKIDQADGVIICTPAYVFSIPSGLKNIIEWCVSTTVFTDKPTGLITASAHGEKGHAELTLIMQTLQATLSEKTSLLIQGVKGKVTTEGEIVDPKTAEALSLVVQSFSDLLLSATSTK